MKYDFQKRIDQLKSEIKELENNFPKHGKYKKGYAQGKIDALECQVIYLQTVVFIYNRE